MRSILRFLTRQGIPPLQTKEEAEQAFKEVCEGHTEAEFGHALLGNGGRWGKAFRERWRRFSQHLPDVERTRKASDWMQRTTRHAPGGIADFH